MTSFGIFFFYIILWTAIVSPTPILKRGYEPKTNIFNFTIEKVTLAPDGFTRQLSTVNGQYPGPTIEVNKGDRIVMNINNKLGEPTAIHGHGMLQRGTPWFDGVPWMAQCVIPDDYEFTYNFTVPEEVGTHWYHAHETLQYVDGAFGALIIHDPDDPYKAEYDEEIIVMLNDYHHTNAQVLLKQFLTPESKGEEVRNIDISTKAPPGSKCVDNAGLAKFEFVQNKKYRLRIINTSAFSAFFFSIDNHEMEVIEADGGYTNRNKIHRLPINVAQRYSVIVTANQPVDNYIMRSEFQKKCMPDAAASLPTIKAIVHYEGAPDGPEPKDNPWSDSLTECVDLDHKTLQPLKEEKIPESTRKLELTIAFHKNTTGVVKAFLNESSYIPDINFPSLDKIFKGKPISETSANAYFFDKDGEVVDIYFVNTDDGDHPFHIHGYQFWVLGTGDGDKVDENNLNTQNPIKRDTATVPALGWIAIRFVSDNPGWHLESGLLMQLVTLPDEILKMQPPKEWTKLCELGER
ncbi:14927_t:CDS:10 [Entrophospora sp. SA101]|nr:14925_t:CDS:10 [Entrophospora sp. SA101]CAJ0628699.1 14927_t:CDS:10 [Entrophospora sp. SA101]CAJ0832066.1 12593_t:CDS:10 [Entrophospora sp. SA101]CAJ0867703.1 19083_t:CDS:10 [Entrophospora sp. SA101]CAJ0867726.1 19085_t:CDS:10 [Entrophospora sp. SA101]